MAWQAFVAVAQSLVAQSFLPALTIPAHFSSFARSSFRGEARLATRIAATEKIPATVARMSFSFCFNSFYSR